MIVQDVYWFTPGPYNNPNPKIIGIVIGNDSVTMAPKAYIGIGRGVDKDEDIKNICDNGAKFGMSDARALLLHLGGL